MNLILAVTILATSASVATAGHRGVQQTPAPSAAISTIDGTWEMLTDTEDEENGPLVLRLVIKSEGKKISGTLAGPVLGKLALKGEYADGRISFTISEEKPEGTMTVSFVGSMQTDGTLAGQLSGAFGEMPWTARRAA